MTDASASEFERQRAFLTGLAYRMLGSFADAQDIVQDAFLRWHGRAAESLDSPRAFLATIVTRLCLDRLHSARHRRETYVGPWLPDPIIERLGADPASPDDHIDAPVALMLALERLSPLERAVFILHELMEMDIDEVAAALDRNAATCRQLLARARRHAGESRPRFAVSPEEGSRIATAFFDAIRTGEVDRLRDLLAEAAILHSDGGGKVPASLNIIFGGDRVFRFFKGIAGKSPQGAGLWSGPLLVNGLPGYVSIDAACIAQATAFAIEDGRIAAVYAIRNPDKLGHAVRFANLPC